MPGLVAMSVGIFEAEIDCRFLVFVSCDQSMRGSSLLWTLLTNGELVLSCFCRLA